MTNTNPTDHAARTTREPTAIVTRATEAITALKAGAESTERRGRLSGASLSTARGLDGFAMAVPTGFGGAGSDATTIARVLVELGRACPSTAWVVGVVATAKSMAAQVIGERALHEAFADPDVIMCGSALPRGVGTRVPGGFVVSGRWAYLSGCEDAAWALLGCTLEAGGGEPPTYSLALIPRGDLSLDRTWHVVGMRGTGSQTLIAGDVFVPEHRVGVMSRPAAAEALFYALTTLGPSVGAARGALDLFSATSGAVGEPSAPSPSRIAESPEARHLLTEATQLVDSATRRMLDVCRAVDGSRAQEAITPFEHAQLKLELTVAAGESRHAVDDLLDLHGSSGFTESNPLQRFWRDLAVGSRHLHLNPFLAMDEYSRQLTAA